MEFWRAGEMTNISEEQGNTDRISNGDREYISKHLVTECFYFLGTK